MNKKDEKEDFGFYKPENLIECFKILDEVLDKKSKDKFKNKDSGYMVLQHFGTGLWIRNQFGLWNKESPLYKYFLKKLLFFHPDDVSSLIMNTYSKYLNNEIDDFENCIFANDGIYNNIDEYHKHSIDLINWMESFENTENIFLRQKMFGAKLYNYNGINLLLESHFVDSDFIYKKKGNSPELVKRNKENCIWKSDIDKIGMENYRDSGLISLRAEGKTEDESFENLIIKIKEFKI